MIWIKSALMGLAAAVATLIAIVALGLATANWWADVGQGSGGIGFVAFVITPLMLLPVILAFALGFWWTVRRERSRSG